MKKFLLIIGLFLSIVGCKSSFLGEEPKDNPVDVFETLWRDFDRHYAVFEERNVNWDSLYNVYRPKISEQINQDSLWNICCILLDHLNDAHVSIYEPIHFSRYFKSNRRRSKPGDFNQNAVQRLLSEPMKSLNNNLKWGKIKNRNIGYIHVTSFDYRQYSIDLIDILMEKVKNHDAMIVDVRMNNGGLSSFAWRLSSWFADNTNNVLYTQFRNGSAHNDFSKKQEHPNFMRDDNLSKIPVVLLTNRHTVSAAEHFTLSMKTFKNVMHIGDTTMGAFSAISFERFLPNGWVYTYSVARVTLPDGNQIEGVGCIPSITILNNAESSDSNHTDNVMKFALEYLQVKHGI